MWSRKCRPATGGGTCSASIRRSAAYIARPDGVTAIDLKTGKATDRIVPGQRVHAALAIPGTHEVISTNGATNNASVSTVARDRFERRSRPARSLDAAAYDPATRTVWIMNPEEAATSRSSIRSSAKVLATVPVGGSLELGVADGAGRMYVNVEDKNEVAVLDTRNRKLLSRFPLKDCEGPTGIAYDAASREIISACSDNGVAIISAPDGRQIARLPIGKGADGAAFDAKRGIALVPAGRDGNVTLIQMGAAPKVAGQVSTAVSARTIAVDPRHRAGLPAFRDARARAGQRTAEADAGTFRVLVVAP